MPGILRFRGGALGAFQLIEAQWKFKNSAEIRTFPNRTALVDSDSVALIFCISASALSSLVSALEDGRDAEEDGRSASASGCAADGAPERTNLPDVTEAWEPSPEGAQPTDDSYSCRCRQNAGEGDKCNPRQTLATL